MTFNPEGINLSSGAGATPDRACLQQKAAILHAHHHGYLDSNGWDAIMTDTPCWQNVMVNRAGVVINDALRTPEGFKLLDQSCTVRMVSATIRETPELERAVNRRLAQVVAKRAQEDADAAQRNAADPDRVPISGYEHDLMLVGWLDWFIDQWEKAVAAEGAMMGDGAADALRDAGLLHDTPSV